MKVPELKFQLQVLPLVHASADTFNVGDWSQTQDAHSLSTPFQCSQHVASSRRIKFRFTATRAVRISQVGTVAPSPKPRLRASCGCKPPSGSETKLSEGPRLRPSESTTRSTAGRAMQVRAARTLMTGRSAATVARYVDVRALRRARR